MRASIARTIQRAALVALAVSPLQCAETVHGRNTVAFADVKVTQLLTDGHLVGTCQSFCEEQYSYLSGHDFRLRGCEPATTPKGDGVVCDITFTESREWSCMDGGRLPSGATLPSVDAVGREAWLERMATLEALSVVAFQRLEVELTTHGAPLDLLARTRRAIRDERRHHAAMVALLGREVRVPEVPQCRPRSLADMLLENAVEGCVHETFGAALAVWQAKRATAPDVRRIMSVIAGEEAKHAQLAHALHRWGARRVTQRQRLRVERARARAMRRLRDNIARGSVAPHHRALGIPAPADALRLLDAVMTAVAAESRSRRGRTQRTKDDRA